MLTTEISNEDYHGGAELSRSTAHALLSTCPAKVKWDRENPPTGKSPALLMGGAFHTATLEPNKLDEEYARKPEEIDGKSPLTKHYKESFAAMQEENPSVSWLKPNDYDDVMRMAAAARSSAFLSSHMEGSVIEGTGFFELAGAKCKVRPDLYHPATKTVIDLKSTQDASPAGFAKSVRQFGYAFQQAWYEVGLRACGNEVENFYFVAVEKAPPHLIGIYSISAGDVSIEKAKVFEACRTWAECEESGNWPGFGDTPETLRLSRMSGKRAHLSELSRDFGISPYVVKKLITENALEVKVLGNRRTVDLAEFTNAVRRLAA